LLESETDGAEVGVSGLLVVDIGNTRTRFGLWEDGGVEGVSAVATESIAGPAEVASQVATLSGAPGGHGLSLALCSVVPRAEAAWLAWQRKQGGRALAIRGDTPTPLDNCYDDPQALGPDRLAAAVGAVRRLGAPVIVVSLGTATVVDAVSEEAEFLGGAIVAGVQTGLTALAERTAALPQVTVEAPERTIGRDTEECLSIGAVVGTAALVEGLAARLRDIVGDSAPLALTGGYAELISEHIWIEHEMLPSLTLEGIATIWEHNRGRA